MQSQLQSELVLAVKKGDSVEVGRLLEGDGVGVAVKLQALQTAIRLAFTVSTLRSRIVKLLVESLGRDYATIDSFCPFVYSISVDSQDLADEKDSIPQLRILWEVIAETKAIPFVVNAPLAEILDSISANGLWRLLPTFVALWRGRLDSPREHQTAAGNAAKKRKRLCD